MKKIKMGVVGAGLWGENHVQIFNNHPFAETVAICDVDIAKAQKIADEYNIASVYDDYTQMAKLSDCDAVSIVTPDYLHADIAIEFANNKKHILIEKPLATSKEDVIRMLDAIRDNGVRAMVDLHNRWNPPFNSAKQLIDDGQLGQIYNAYFRLNDAKWVATDMLKWAAKSSILWFLGSHSIDTLCWLFSSKVKRVYSVSRRGVLDSLGVAATDVYLTTLEFENGCIAQMENGWITPNANTCVNDFKCTVSGTNGMINIDASSHNCIQLVTDKKVTTPDIFVKNYVNGKPNGFAYQSICSFVDCLVSGDDFLVSLEDAADVTLVILAIKKSAELRCPVMVEY